VSGVITDHAQDVLSLYHSALVADLLD